MSKRFSLSEVDVEKWVKNTAIFFAPALLLFLLAIQSGKSVEDALLVIYTWLLSTSIDLVRKYIASN